MTKKITKTLDEVLERLSPEALEQVKPLIEGEIVNALLAGWEERERAQELLSRWVYWPKRC